MRYLTIAPDYTGSCLHDDFDGAIDLSDLALPDELFQEMTYWHTLYRKFIPMSLEQRIVYSNEIDMLDQQGLALVEKLNLYLQGEAKIRYFSEGQLRYL